MHIDTTNLCSNVDLMWTSCGVYVESRNFKLYRILKIND